MPQTFTKKVLSASTNGRPIAVTATATAGTALHTGTAAKFHQVLLAMSNLDSSDVEVTLEIGGTATGDKQLHTIPPKRTIEIPAILIYGAQSIAAFASSANKINVTGEVNEIA